VPEKVASVAAAATGIASAAKAVEKAQLAPELHVVESGENFWTISRHYYSSGRYYMALWKANSRTVPAADKLMVGQTIIIPPPEALDRSLIEPPRVGTGSSSSRAGAPVRRTSRSKPNADDPADTPVRRSSEVELILPIDNSVLDRRSRSGASEELDPPPEKRYRAARPRYKVRAHETLRSIARDTLNDKRRADEIYELNRDILGNDPYKMLVEGQILELPEDARSGRRSR
jgi:nucleoid-associated protein YgaU